MSRIALIIGHPDPDPARYGRALAAAYADGARAAGHVVDTLDVATLDWPPVRGAAAWRAPASDQVRAAQEIVGRADHLVVIYPLWLGDMPALLKSFFENLSCGGFVMSLGADGRWQRHLAGKSARIVVTMGMPAFIYRWFFFSHSLKSLERNILKFAGASPVRSTVIGSIEEPDGAAREKWLARMSEMGRAAE